MCESPDLSSFFTDCMALSACHYFIGSWTTGGMFEVVDLYKIVELLGGKLGTVVTDLFWDAMSGKHRFHCCYYPCRGCVSQLDCLRVSGEVVI